MKKIILISTLVSLFLSTPSAIAAMDHGSNGNRGRSNNPACKSQGVGQVKPAHLTNVSPGSEFSFWVVGLKNPKEVNVTVKNIPVTVTAEDKKNFYLFKGHLPKELTGTVARIMVDVSSKKCPSEKGWLVRIGE
ncbi:MAG: hypothetical protein Q9M50_12440 [Methylococcales bacterium]|nr:hypothetical protein [Methylococcales bacterium]